MSRTLKTLAVFALIMACLSASANANDAAKQKKKKDKKHGKPGVSLLKPDTLDGWGYFLVKEEGAEKAPEMADVWSIAKGVLSCKGVPMGYLSTDKTYENFSLTFQWRWPKGVEPTNSGVFLRITGEDRALPKCVELQLKHKSAGDLIGFHGMTLDGPADRLVKKENEIGGKLSILPKVADGELPAGEWNKGKVVVRGETITVWINGKEVNQATGVPLLAGKIGLQSEGGPIEFRKVMVKKIKQQKQSRDLQVAVEGRVTLDGKPLDNCLVKFLPASKQKETQQPHAKGKTDSQGFYRLRVTPKQEDNTTGAYRVTIEDLSTATNKARTSRIQAHYQSPSETPLFMEIKPGKNIIDFDLSSP